MHGQWRCEATRFVRPAQVGHRGLPAAGCLGRPARFREAQRGAKNNRAAPSQVTGVSGARCCRPGPGAIGRRGAENRATGGARKQTRTTAAAMPLYPAR